MTLLRRLLHLFSRSSMEREIDAELRSHIEMRFEDNLADGMNEQAAARDALLRFGNLTATREYVAGIDAATGIRGAWRDVIYALRGFRRDTAFSVVAIVTLALGIGANAGIYTVLNAVLLKSLPVNKPEQLRLLKLSDELVEQTRFSYPILERMRVALPATASLAMMSWPTGFNVKYGEAETDRQTGQLVSGDFFSTLQTHPVMGRLLSAQDDQADSSSVAVLSYEYWSQRLGQNASVLNQKILINGIPVTIVGITAPGFFGVRVGVAPAFWLPLRLQPLVRYDQHFSEANAIPSKPWAPQLGIRWLQPVLRVTEAGDTPRIIAELNAIDRDEVQLEARDEPAAERLEAFSRPRIELVQGNKGFEKLQKQFSRPLLLLMGMAFTLLLIACANIASLMLARAATRRREIAVRLALGARRRRVVRQLLTESTMLSFSGGLLGVSVAWWCAHVLPRWASNGPSPISLNLTPDTRVLCFSVAVSLATGILFGLVPALQSTQVEISSVLKASSPGVQGRGSRAKGVLTGGKLLVAAQVALSLTLLIAAGLFLQTIRNYNRLDTGFDRTHTLTAHLDSHPADFSPEQLKLLYSKIPQAIEAIPGVRSASIATCGLSSGCLDSSDVNLRPPGVSVQSHVYAQVNTVTPGYFSTVGIPLLQGRIFTAADRENTPGVAVVNETFVRRFIKSRAAIGASITDSDDPTGAHSAEIVGIVGDARANDVREEAPPLMYFSMNQYHQGLVSLDVRAMGDPHLLQAQVKAALAKFNIAPQQIVTLQDQIEQNLAQQRAVSRLTTLFGLLALLLAVLGLYGTIAYDVARRTGEIGLRLALGSTQAGVQWLILKESFAVMVVGITSGVFLSLVMARVAKSLLFGLSVQDPTTFVVAAIVLLAPALCAGAVPAWRAANVSPTEALRME